MELPQLYYRIYGKECEFCFWLRNVSMEWRNENLMGISFYYTRTNIKLLNIQEIKASYVLTK